MKIEISLNERTKNYEFVVNGQKLYACLSTQQNCVNHRAISDALTPEERKWHINDIARHLYSWQEGYGDADRQQQIFTIEELLKVSELAVDFFQCKISTPSLIEKIHDPITHTLIPLSNTITKEKEA